MQFLSHDGLIYFWEKIKKYIDTQDNSISSDVNTLNTNVDNINSQISTINSNVAGKAAIDHNHVNTVIFPAYIEFTPGSSDNNGGYIDFHWNGSSADYTSRIMESASGSITIDANTRVGNPDPASGCSRNICAGTDDMVAGSSALNTGEIYLVYE